jgi:hypothetical protein
VSIPLRLVTPHPAQTPEVPDDQPAPDPEPARELDPDPDLDPELEPRPEPALDLEVGNANEPEPEDIWSRLRDRSLPPWIPFLVGAATAALTGLIFLLTALRRLRRRGFPGE